jgi:hypothetical protein
VHNWVDKFAQGRSKVVDEHRSGRPVQIAWCGCAHVAETAAQRLLCSRYWDTDKTVGQVY